MTLIILDKLDLEHVRKDIRIRENYTVFFKATLKFKHTLIVVEKAKLRRNMWILDTSKDCDID